MAYNFLDFKKRMTAIADHLTKELSAIQTGRATLAVLDSVLVDAYGSRMQIPHLATISILDARSVRVVPFDKTNGKGIEKAINEANLGVSVSAEEEGLRIFFPELTTERRVSFTKIVREKVEDARISVRGEREKTKNAIIHSARDGEMNEDDKTRALEELQKIIDETNAALEKIGGKKENDIIGL